MNFRLRKAGHLVWLDPGLRVTYWPRDTWNKLARQFLSTGIWRGELTRRLGAKNPLRFFAPPVLVVNLVVALVVALLQVTGVLSGAVGLDRVAGVPRAAGLRRRARRSRRSRRQGSLARPAPLRRRAGDDAHLLGRRLHRRHPPRRRRLRRHVPPRLGCAPLRADGYAGWLGRRVSVRPMTWDVRTSPPKPPMNVLRRSTMGGREHQAPFPRMEQPAS